MATKWNFLANSLKIFSSETAGRILKLFHRICSLGDPFQKIDREILIRQNLWLW